MLFKGIFYECWNLHDGHCLLADTLDACSCRLEEKKTRLSNIGQVPTYRS